MFCLQNQRMNQHQLLPNPAPYKSKINRLKRKNYITCRQNNKSKKQCIRSNHSGVNLYSMNSAVYNHMHTFILILIYQINRYYGIIIINMTQQTKVNTVMLLLHQVLLNVSLNDEYSIYICKLTITQ